MCANFLWAISELLVCFVIAAWGLLSTKILTFFNLSAPELFFF